MKENARASDAGEVPGSKPENNDISHRHPTAQDRQNKPRIVRAVAPPLGAYHPDTITAIIEMVALHLRRTIPVLADLTLNDFEGALADLRPQLAELLDEED